MLNRKVGKGEKEERGRVTTNYTNVHESPGMPAPRAAWRGEGEGVACRASSTASALTFARPDIRRG